MGASRESIHRRWKQALSDVRQRRYLDAYIGWLLAIAAVVVAIVASFGKTTDRPNLFIAAVSVFLLGIIALATAEIRRDMPKQDRGEVGPIWRFFAGRRQLPSITEQLQFCTTEATIVGLQLGAIVHQYLPEIEQRCRRGVKIRLALLSPTGPDGQSLVWVNEMGLVHNVNNLEETLRTSLNRLKDWSAGLPAGTRRNVEIRVYRHIPTASVVIVDPETRDGYIHVEPIMYRMDPSQRPSFWLRRRDDEELFGVLLRRYTDLWDAATPLREAAL